jgi:hypothetical protein
MTQVEHNGKTCRIYSLRGIITTIEVLSARGTWEIIRSEGKTAAEIISQGVRK